MSFCIIKKNHNLFIRIDFNKVIQMPYYFVRFNCFLIWIYIIYSVIIIQNTGRTNYIYSFSGTILFKYRGSSYRTPAIVVVRFYCNFSFIKSIYNCIS